MISRPAANKKTCQVNDDGNEKQRPSKQQFQRPKILHPGLDCQYHWKLIDVIDEQANMLWIIHPGPWKVAGQ